MHPYSQCGLISKRENNTSVFDGVAYAHAIFGLSFSDLHECDIEL